MSALYYAARDYICSLPSTLYAMKDAPMELRESKDAMIAAVTIDGYSLKFASRELRNDFDVVYTAVSNEGDALKYASHELRNNRKIVLQAVSKNGYAMQYTLPSLRNDHLIVTKAVKCHGLALEFASKSHRGDRFVVFGAITQNGLALMYASDMLKDDEPTVRIAVQQNPEAIMYASARVQAKLADEQKEAMDCDETDVDEHIYTGMWDLVCDARKSRSPEDLQGYFFNKMKQLDAKASPDYEGMAYDTACEALQLPLYDLAKWTIENCEEELEKPFIFECAVANVEDDVDFVKNLVANDLAIMGPNTEEILFRAAENHNLLILDWLIFEMHIDITPEFYEHLFFPRYDVELIKDLRRAGLPWPTESSMLNTLDPFTDTPSLHDGDPDPEDRQAVIDFLKEDPMGPAQETHDDKRRYRIGDNGTFNAVHTNV